MSTQRLRLRDRLAGHTSPPDEPEYEADDLVGLASDEDKPDVDEAVRECRRSHVRLWERIEAFFRRERR